MGRYITVFVCGWSESIHTRGPACAMISSSKWHGASICSQHATSHRQHHPAAICRMAHAMCIGSVMGRFMSCTSRYRPVRYCLAGSAALQCDVFRCYVHVWTSLASRSSCVWRAQCAVACSDLHRTIYVETADRPVRCWLFTCS